MEMLLMFVQTKVGITRTQLETGLVCKFLLKVSTNFRLIFVSKCKHKNQHKTPFAKYNIARGLLIPFLLTAE